MATLLARGQITIAAIKDGADGKNYWQQDVWVDLSAAAYDWDVWYPVVGEALPKTGFAGIKVVVNLNSGTKPSWSTHSLGFSVDFHIDTQASGWGVTPGETIIYSDNYAWCPVSPVSYKQLEKGSIPILYLRGGGRYRVFSTYDASWKTYKDGYTWEVDNYSQSAMPSNSRPTPEGHTLKGEKGDKGEDGVDGTDGKDAVSVLVENAPLVFDTNDDGIVSPDISKLAKVKIMRGNRNVSDECSDVSSRDDMCVNCVCGVTQENGYISVSVLGSYITKNDVVVDGVSQGEVSATSGYAVAQATYGGVTYFAQVPFSVNVAKFTGVVAFDNNGYKSQFKEVTNRLNDTATKDDLKKAESDFKQTAREISLSVSEKLVGRRNLLPGSAFSRQEGFGLNLDANTKGYGILMNDGVDGMNCIKVASYYDGTRYQYCGAFWGGNWTGRNIRIKHGTKYTFSCLVKVDTPNANVYLEILYEKAESGMDRDDRPTGEEANSYFFAIKEANKWQLIKWSFITDNTHNWVEANVYTCSSIKRKTFVAWFCKPMLEEGDYNGWTLSQDDYDYIGGNMLDNTLSLDKSGTLNDMNGTLTPAGFGDSTSIYKSFTYKLKGTVDSFSQLPSSGNVYDDTYYVRNNETCYAYNGSEFVNVGNDYYFNVLEWRKQKSGAFIPFGLEANKDYVFSFMAKGTGKLTAYFYNPDTNVFIEDSLGGTDIAVNGQANFQLTNKWERYWVHWRPSDSLHKYVLLRLNRSIQSSNGDAPITDCYIAQPKLEEGAMVTEYTERKSDLVDKASLKKAGIEVKSDEVLLYGDRIRVNNNGQTAALFTGGKINASLIDADKIEVKHLWAKSNDGANKVGYFGNTEEEACKIDDTYAPLFVGADMAKNSPFYVTNKGHMVSKSATLGSFSLNESCLRYLTGYDDEEPGFALYNEYMVFRGYSRTFSPQTKKWTSERNRLIWVGRNDWVYSVPSLMSNILVQDSFPMTTGDTAKIGLRISVTGCDDKYQYEDVNYNGAMGSNVYGNFAIYAENGMYAGFRPMTRMANYSMKLTELDCVIYVSVTGITLTLPDNPQRGQCYKFIQGAGSFYIKSSSKNIYSMHVGQTDNFTSDSYNQITEIIWIGDHWRINWFRESVGK